METAKPVNLAFFLLSVMLTGAIAGAFVWLVLYAMDLGLEFIWDGVASWFGRYYPILMCVIGGVVIALFARRYGNYPEDLRTVLAKVKRDGSYPHDKLGVMSVAALLPLVFGGSVGPEAGLTGVIAGLCSWVGERLRRFGEDFRELTEAGVTATLSALFTAPLYGFAVGLDGSRERNDAPSFTGWKKALIYAFAVIGALGSFLLLTHFIGGGLPLPHYEWTAISTDEVIWLIPLVIVGATVGMLFLISDIILARFSDKLGNKMWKPVVAGLLLGICGVVLPLTMFSGESQSSELDGMWTTMSAAMLITIGVVKVLVTAMCVNMGWRGGHFFPIIFAGISIGYGMAAIAGIDPVFSLCVVTAALLGAVMRKPLMVVLLLFLCFPLISAIPMFIAALVGSRIPVPTSLTDGAEAAA